MRKFLLGLSVVGGIFLAPVAMMMVMGLNTDTGITIKNYLRQVSVLTADGTLKWTKNSAHYRPVAVELTNNDPIVTATCTVHWRRNDTGSSDAPQTYIEYMPPKSSKQIGGAEIDSIVVDFQTAPAGSLWGVGLR